MTHVEDRPFDYARTLHAWRTAFTARVDEVRRLGFRTRHLGLLHVMLARVGDDLV